MGELPILDFYQNRAAYVRSRWIAPGWQWVDPKNEIQAAVSSVDANLSTLAEEAATQGQDWEDNLEQRARELKKIKELEEKNGIKMTATPPPFGKGNFDPATGAPAQSGGQSAGDQPAAQSGGSDGGQQ